MSAEMDDPFTTPGPSARFSNLDPPPLLPLPLSSPSQVKRTLEAHLQEVNKRIETAATLGRTLLGQQQEIEARIKEVGEGGDQIGPELKKKLVDLEKEYNEVGRESARAVLTNKVMAGPGGGNGGAPSFDEGNLPGNTSTLQTQGSSSPSKLSVPPSRRQRNQPSRQHDLEFAADIGQGLLIEVRRLQALLSEREETLKAAQLHGSRLERHTENLEVRIKSLDESEQKFKDQNWNLELSIQELHSKAAEHKDTETKLQAQIAHMGHEKNMVIKELDEWKHQNGKLYEDLEAEHKHHEYELAAMKKKLASNETDQVELQSAIEELKQQLEESHKASLRLRQLEQRPDREDALKDPFDLQPTETTPENSPPPSPTKQTPRHTMLEAETVRSSLNHAHRMIANLKSSVHREKSEKAELKRLLQDARDELEAARSNLGNGLSGSAGKRRKNDGLFRKPVLRPNINANLLGGPRKSKDEVTLIESPGDGDWEEAPDGPITPNAQASQSSEQNRSPSGMADYDRDGTDAFETADEQGANATETEAYKTGNESPMADYPTSADELTETEASPHDPKTKSHASPFGMRPLRPLRFRHRDSVASATSTEDDDDSRRRYASLGTGTEGGLGGQHHGIMGAIHSGSSRLKLRVNKFRGRGTRVTSESSLFSNRPLSAGSSSVGGSPASLNPQLSTPGERKSLFAELGDSPMIGTDDGEDEYEYIEPDTPTKSFIRPAQMVDCSVMTEEPYPEQFFLRTPGEHERPKTAVTIKDAPPTTSVGVQSTPEPVIAVQMTDAAVQSLGESRAAVNEIGTQSDEIPLPQVAEAGTQSDGELGGNTVLPTPAPVVPNVNETAIKREMKDSGTQFVPELEKVEKKGFSVGFPVSFPSIRRSSARPVKEMRSVETQFDPELESAVLAQETGAIPAVPLELSGIHSQDTIPVEPPAPVEPAPAPVPVPALIPGVDASASSDEVTPKKVSETVEEAQQRPTTPSPTMGAERPGFFGSVFSWRRGGSITSKPGTPVGGSERPTSGEPPAESQPTSDAPTNLGKIPEPPIESQLTPDIPTNPREIPEPPTASEPTPDIQINPDRVSEPPQLPKAVATVDQTVQTDISSDFFNEVPRRAEKPIDKGKRPAYMVNNSQASINGDKSSARTASLRSGPSQESISRTGLRVVGAGLVGVEAARSQPGLAPKRPGSASSQWEARLARPPLPPDHKEHIAAAQQKGVVPYEPGAMGPPPVPTARTNVAFRPKTPVHDRISRDSETPGSRGGTTPRPRFSTSRSEVSSPTSRRSSISSFASELDERFNIQAHNNGGPSRSGNPTDPRMIQAITQTMIGEYLWKYTRNTGRSNSRHKRFIWVHPYTRTLYWSKWDPTAAGRNELRTKSVAIEAIRVITDDNPLPPGLHRKSLVIMTPGKSLKFTAPTAQRHETWFNALSYLLLRTGGELEDENAVTADDVNDFNPGYSGAGRGTTSEASYNSRTTHGDDRNASSLSNRRPGESSMRQGSMSRLGHMFRTTSGFATFSSKSSRHNASIYDASEMNDSAEELRLQIEKEEREADRLENVRACCDGKHDVGTLTRKPGRRSTQSARGRVDSNQQQPKSNSVNGHERNHSHS